MHLCKHSITSAGDFLIQELREQRCRVAVSCASPYKVTIDRPFESPCMRLVSAGLRSTAGEILNQNMFAWYNTAFAWSTAPV
jgi:hypothetical protein